MSDASSENAQLRSEFESLKNDFNRLQNEVEGIKTNVAKLYLSRTSHRAKLKTLRNDMDAILGDPSESYVAYEPMAGQTSARSSVVAEVFDKLNKTKI